MRKYQMLQSEKNDLEDKLYQLEEELGKTQKKVEEARAQGDLSENSEYENSIARLKTIAKDIEDTEEKLKNCEIIEKSNGDTVGLGSVVHFRYRKTNEERVYTIVGDGFGNVLSNKISKSSPLGSALYNKELHIGSTVTYKDNKNRDVDIEILGVN